MLQAESLSANSAYSSSVMRVLTTRLRCGVLYRFRMVKTSFRLPHGCGGISGVSRISRVWGRHSPTRFPQEQNERKANFGTAVESCSVTAADCPCPGFSVYRANRAGLPARFVLSFSSVNMTPERGFAARWLRLFPFPLKIHFKGRQLPAGQEFSQIFFRFCNAGNEILATGGAENFSFHSLHHRVLKFAKQNGKFFPTPYYGQKSKMPNAGAEKFLPHLLLQSEQGKMAGNGAGQQKKQQIFFRLTAFAGRR